MTHWEIIHTRFPVICEGEERRKGGYKGCCAWNGEQGKCNHTVLNLSGDIDECHLSIEGAIEQNRAILKGQI